MKYQTIHELEVCNYRFCQEFNSNPKATSWPKEIEPREVLQDRGGEPGQSVIAEKKSDNQRWTEKCDRRW